MAQQILPLDSSPNQSLACVLNVDGKPLPLGFTFRYNEIADYWIMAIFSRTGVLLINSLPLVTGNDPACNILGKFAYLGIGSAFVINVSGTLARNYPGASDLGSDFILIWGDTPLE